MGLSFDSDLVLLSLLILLLLLFKIVGLIVDKSEVGVIRLGNLNESKLAVEVVVVVDVIVSKLFDFSRLRRRSLADSVKL